jgi:DNA-binding NarL/FixJ family response regulator
MGTTNDKKLLIVDHSPIIIERLVEALREHPQVAKVYTATDYDEAVGMLEAKKLDYVILDIHLNTKSGIDLLKFIVKDYPAIKTIVFSNLADDNYFRLCKEIGATYCLDKSKDFELIPTLLNAS